MRICFRNILVLFIVSFSISDFASAQQTTTKTDSTHIYKNIESYSKRSKLGKFMYRLVFKPVAIDLKKKEVKKKGYNKLIQKPYSVFEGKIIRNINIVTLDPFGYSISDTTVQTQSILSKAGNQIHIKTQNIAIRNLLLIRKNKPFNSLIASSAS